MESLQSSVEKPRQLQQTVEELSIAPSHVVPAADPASSVTGSTTATDATVTSDVLQEESSTEPRNRKARNSSAHTATARSAAESKFDFALDPNEPVFQGTMKYPPSFIFGQVLLLLCNLVVILLRFV